MSIPKSITEYVRLYPNIFSDDICDSTVKDLQSVNWQQHQYFQYKDLSHRAYSNEPDVTFDYVPHGPGITKALWSVIESYILKDFVEFNKWFDRWNGYTALRFNRYGQGSEMRMHCDHIHEMFDGVMKGIPTLSIIGSLNDDFEGGSFVLWEDTEINIPKGAVLIFPSNFMFPHRVEPVTSGVRYTYVSWVY